MVLTYVQQHLHSLRADHRYVIAQSTAAITSAALALDANSTPAPVANSLASITLHVENDNGTYKLVLMRTAAQVVGGDYFLRLDGSNTNAQIGGADVVFHLHSGLSMSATRLTGMTGTNLSSGTSVALATTIGAATNMVAFEGDGLPLLSVVVEGGDNTNTALVVEHTDSESLLSVTGSGTSASPFVVAFTGTFASLSAADKTMYSNGRTVSLTVSDSNSRVATGFFKVYRFADPAFTAETNGGVVTEMGQNYTTFADGGLYLPTVGNTTYYALSINAGTGVGNAGTSLALATPGDNNNQFLSLDVGGKDSNGVILVNFNGDNVRGTKWQTTVGYSVSQTAAGITRTWTDGNALTTASAALETRLGGDAASRKTVLSTFGVFTLRAIASIALNPKAYCIRSQVGGGNQTLNITVVNGLGNSTTAYSFSDTGISAASNVNTSATAMQGVLAGNIDDNAYLSAPRSVTCTATVVDVGLDAPTGTGAAWGVITQNTTLQVYENIEANLVYGSLTVDGLSQTGLTTWASFSALAQTMRWWGDAALAQTLSQSNPFGNFSGKFAYAVSGTSVSVYQNGNASTVDVGVIATLQTGKAYSDYSALAQAAPYWGDETAAQTYATNTAAEDAYVIYRPYNNDANSGYVDAYVKSEGAVSQTYISVTDLVSFYTWAPSTTSYVVENTKHTNRYAFTGATGIHAVNSKVTGSADQILINDIAKEFTGGYGARTIALNNVAAEYADLVGFVQYTGLLNAGGWDANTAWLNDQAAAEQMAADMQMTNLHFIYANNYPFMSVAYWDGTQVQTANKNGTTDNITWAMLGQSLRLKSRATDLSTPTTLSMTCTDAEGNTLTVGAVTAAPGAFPSVAQRTFTFKDYIGETVAGAGAPVAYWYSKATLSVMYGPAMAVSGNSPSEATTAGSEALEDRWQFDNFPETFPLSVTGSHPAANAFASYLVTAMYDGVVKATGAGFTASTKVGATLGSLTNGTITEGTVQLINDTPLLSINAQTFTLRITLSQISMPSNVSSNISVIQPAIEVQTEGIIDVMIWMFTMTENPPLVTINYNSEQLSSNGINLLTNQSDGKLVQAYNEKDPSLQIADLAPTKPRIVMEDQDLRITSGYNSRLIVVASGSTTTEMKEDLEQITNPNPAVNGAKYSFTVQGAVQNYSNTTDLQIISGGVNYPNGLEIPSGQTATITLQLNPAIDEVSDYTASAATATEGGATVRYYYLVLSAKKPLIIPVVVTSMGALTSIAISEVASECFEDSFSGQVDSTNIAPSETQYDWQIYQGDSTLVVNPPEWGVTTAESYVIKSGENQTKAQITAALKNLPTRRWTQDGTSVNTGSPINYAYLVAAREGSDNSTRVYSQWVTPTPAGPADSQTRRYSTRQGQPTFQIGVNTTGTHLVTAQRLNTTEANAPVLDREQVAFKEISRTALP